MNPTLHRRWLITSGAVGLLIYLIPAGMAFWAGPDIAEWMMFHLRDPTSSTAPP